MGHQYQDQQPDNRRLRIWVQGRLGEHFTQGLDGVDQQDVADGTMLSGDLIDQSRLHSVLDHLRRLGIEVLRFEVDPLQPSSVTPGVEHQEPTDPNRSEEEQ
jgi:hypothetical protein